MRSQAVSRGSVLLLAVLFVAVPVGAADYVGRTPPRLSLVEGQVSLWRSGSADWEDAEINLPLAPGDYLYSGPSSRLEMQVGPRAFVRASSDTQIGIEEQDASLLQLDMPQGRVALDLRELQPGARVEVKTPQGVLNVSDSGFYDINVSPNRATFTAHQGGRGIVTAGGESVDLRSGSEVVAGGSTALARFAAPAPDEWVRWNSERTDRILSATSRGNVSDDIYGAQDLDNYGTWRDEPNYGPVWVPSYVGAGWAPYSSGRWLWDGDYGWSWVDTAPWGWAPYHYGRWVWFNSYWGWAPGPVVAPVYAPALVTFFGAPGFSVSVGVGFPYVSWVALGWGEPIYPWWGPGWFRGRPCWSGWGGGHHNNNWDHGRGHFRNQDAPNGVVSVRRRDFARRQPDRVQMAAGTQRNLQPIRNGLAVEPNEVGVKNTHGPDRGRPTRPARPSELQVARNRSDAQGGVGRPEPRRLEQPRGPERAGAGEPQAPSDLRRPLRPLPSRLQSDPVASNRTRPEPPSRAPQPSQSGDLTQRPRASQPSQSVDAQRPRASREIGQIARDSSNLTRPDPPVRPFRQRPARQTVQDAYSAPTRSNFNSAPRQREIPRGEMPDRARSYSGSGSSRADAPARPYSAPAAAPRQRSGGDAGFRGSQRPAVGSMNIPSRPQRSDSGGGSGGSGGGSGFGLSAPHAARPMPSGPQGGGGHGHRSR